MDEFDVVIGDTRFDPADLPPGLKNLDDDAAPSPHLVQVRRPVGTADRERLAREFGLTFQEYVPNLTYIEHLDPNRAASLRSDELIRACVPLAPVLKRSPLVGNVRTNASDDVGPDELQEIDFILFESSDPTAVTSALRDLGATDIQVLDDRSHGGTLRVRATVANESEVSAIADFPEVRWIEPVSVIVDDNHLAASTIQSGDPLHASVWERGLHGENQVISIMDSSPVDVNHCFFRDVSGSEPGRDHRKVLQVRNITGTVSSSHATFVAGCAAGDDVNDSGNAPRRGGAWAAKLVSGNRLDLSNGTTILEELTAASIAGAFIHSNSWHADAGKPTKYNQLAADVDNFLWNNEDHVLFGSSGNSNEEQGPPGTAKNALCVSAAMSHPNELRFGDGNSGPTSDGRRKPDLVAVGGDIQSAKVGTSCTTGTRSLCATSYATPHAAAAGALVRQYFMEGWYPDGAPSPSNRLRPSGALIKAMLINSARPMEEENYPNDRVGWGLIRLDNCLSFAGAPMKLFVVDVPHNEGLSTSDLVVHRIDIDNSALELRITLVWSDPPGSVLAGSSLVNNLDLVVTSPSGLVFFGNNFAGVFSAVGGSADALNNVEVVAIEQPEEGTWNIEIRAVQVNVAKPAQGYALCVTGGIKRS